MKKGDLVARCKPWLFIAALLPLSWLLFAAVYNHLGTDPAEVMAHETGQWALRFLLMTLAVTSVKSVFGWSWLMRYRRMLGLFSLFYGVVHLLVYLTFFIGWDWRTFIEEAVERPYIFAGMAALGLLIPLGLTSTRAMMRRLGKRWKPLHRMIYPAALLAMLHFFWQTRSDFGEPLFYFCVLLLLLLLRPQFRTFFKQSVSG